MIRLKILLLSIKLTFLFKKTKIIFQLKNIANQKLIEIIKKEK
jgi:hypothetical protein